jgi:hypothetical protein
VSFICRGAEFESLRKLCLLYPSATQSHVKRNECELQQRSGNATSGQQRDEDPSGLRTYRCRQECACHQRTRDRQHLKMPAKMCQSPDRRCCHCPFNCVVHAFRNTTTPGVRSQHPRKKLQRLKELQKAFTCAKLASAEARNVISSEQNSHESKLLDAKFYSPRRKHTSSVPNSSATLRFRGGVL